MRVEDGEPVKARFNGEAVDPADQHAYLPPLTVDALFDEIDGLTGADDVHVTYDEVSGYPTRVDVDYDRSAIDDEVTYEVISFEPG